MPPQPPRWPRLEQKTRCPLADWPSVLAGSLPRRTLCRFRVSFCPQRGQRCCLREKTVPSTLRDPGQNEMENATWADLLPQQKIVVESFWSTALLRRRGSFQKGRESGGGRRLNGTATLSPGTNRNLVCDYHINSAQKRHFLRRQLGPQQPTWMWICPSISMFSRP